MLPFGERALRHFMFLERPEGMVLGDPLLEGALERAVPAVELGEIVPQLQDFATIGHLYRSIENGLQHLAELYGEARLFCGPARAQANAVHFGWPELVTIAIRHPRSERSIPSSSKARARAAIGDRPISDSSSTSWMSM